MPKVRQVTRRGVEPSVRGRQGPLGGLPPVSGRAGEGAQISGVSLLVGCYSGFAVVGLLHAQKAEPDNESLTPRPEASRG
jgi:hypothetical protein